MNGGVAADALVDRGEQRAHAVEEIGVAAVLEEHRLALGAGSRADGRDRCGCTLPFGAVADQERLALDHQRQIRAHPSVSPLRNRFCFSRKPNNASGVKLPSGAR